MTRIDVIVAAALGAAVMLCKLLYLPGHAALQAWRTLNNPILYADRYAFPELFPNDRIISHLRDIYPFLSIVYWAPAVLLKYFGIPPEHISFIVVAINDPLIVVAVFWLGRAFRLSREVSVLAGLFVVASRVLSWDLGGYEYYGHDFAYSGSFYLPFAIGVVPSLMFGRYVLAVILATITALVFAPAGALMCGVIIVVLFVNRAEGSWRRVAPWFALPLLTFAWSAWIQIQIAARIKERFTPAEDLEVVMANGHFVPLWLSGQFLASPYLGFFLLCALGALAWRQWRQLSAPQLLPILVLAVFTIAGGVAGFVAVQLGWTFMLRLGPFRYFLLLGVVITPLIVNELVVRMQAGDWPTRVIAALLFTLLIVDRGTAWMLPLTLPCVAFLALRHRLGSSARWAAPIVAVIAVAASLDMLLQLRVAEAIWSRLDTTGRVASLLGEAARRLDGAGPELLLLAAAAGASIFVVRRGAMMPAWVPRALALFVFACIASRTALNASWAAAGPPMRFAEAQLWARESTPLSAKFIAFELESGQAYLAWQTLSQRSGAEMQYTHQKVYLPDRELLEIDRAVSAYYGFSAAAVEGKVYPFYASDLYQKYQQFSREDFLRVARLSASNFAVLKKPRTAAFPIAFENDLFTVYRMPAQFGDLLVTPVAIGDRSIAVSWDAAAGARPSYRMRAEFRDARTGEVVAADCCVIIGSSAGTHVFHLPRGVKGNILALIGVDDPVSGARVPLLGDASGEHLAFWEHLVAD